MIRAGIWEQDGGILGAVRAGLGARSAEIDFISGSHPADFTAGPLDLLCVSADAVGWAGLNAVNCRMLLIPGALGPMARGLRCPCAVSYGTSPKDSLTFSSLEGDHICVALQRELVTLEGGVVEQQELVLPFPPGCPPLSYLAAVGVLLLLGATPAELSG